MNSANDLPVVFADPNSSTNTTCSKSWIDTNGTSSAPTAYLQCEATGTTDETFQWQITTYSSIQAFSLRFVHGWNDPAYVSP